MLGQRSRMLGMSIGCLWLALAASADEPPAPTAEEISALVREYTHLFGDAEQLWVRHRYAEAIENVERAAPLMDRLEPHLRSRQDRIETAACRKGSGSMLAAVGRYDEALASMRRAEAIYDRLIADKMIGNEKYPDAQAIGYTNAHHIECLQSLGRLLLMLGETERGLAYCQRVAEVQSKAYELTKKKQNGGRDFPDFSLADALHTLSMGLMTIDRYKEAIPYLVRAESIYAELYADQLEREERFGKVDDEVADALGDNGRDLAPIRLHLGIAYDAVGNVAKARELVASALEVYRHIYPKGDPELVYALIREAQLYVGEGEDDGALKRLAEVERLLAALYPAKLFPERHPLQTTCAAQTGSILARTGKPEEAARHLRSAFENNQWQVRRYAAAMSESEALAYLRDLPAARDDLLSVLRQVSDSDAQAYDCVWRSKALFLQILKSRQSAAAIARSGDAALNADWEKLIDIRRRLSTRLSAPSDAALEQEYLGRFTREKEALETKVAARLKQRGIRPEEAAIGPELEQIAENLPSDAAFIDFIAYSRPQDSGKRTRHYAAFVMLPAKAPVRVELGPAEKIDEAVGAWRAAIAAGTDRSEAGSVHRLVWEPLRPKLPPGVKTLYLSPDGKLAHIPWAALPGARTNRVLLEDFAGGIATVPSGPYLLEQLRSPAAAPAGDETLLAVGGVDYGKPSAGGPAKIWPELKWTDDELHRVIAVAGNRKITQLVGGEATVPNLIEAVRKTPPRYLHLATHGRLDEQAFTAEQARSINALRFVEMSTSKFSLPPAYGNRSPLAFSSLVFANANLPAGGDKESGYLTGEVICALPLEGTRLAVLSACETSLGSQLEGDEVLYGLSRAFHVAGCENVMGSLWQVDDAATAALMNKFYFEYWKNGKSPREALRAAQLMVLNQPEVVPLLASARGPLDLNAVAKAKPKEPQAAPGKRAATKLWASFALSGAGR